jgi:hypothetical protein
MLCYLAYPGKSADKTVWIFEFESLKFIWDLGFVIWNFTLFPDSQV